MTLKTRLAGLALVSAFALTGCATTTELVDHKQELPVPGSNTVCYFVEIEVKEGEKEISEENKCVTKAEYDKQKVGQAYVN